MLSEDETSPQRLSIVLRTAETDAAHGHNIVMALVQCIGHFAAVADVSFPALVRQRHDTWRLGVDAKVTLV